MDRKLLYEKINNRCKDMFNGGAIEEVQSLLKKCNHSHPLHKAIGLDPISLLLLGKDKKRRMHFNFYARY